MPCLALLCRVCKQHTPVAYMPCCHLRQVTTAIRGLANKEVLQGQQEVKQAVLSALEQAEQRLAEQAERHRLYYIRAWSLLVAKLA